MRAESDRIYEILNNNAALTALVNDKIFPLVADQGIQYPFVNYHVSEDPAYSKDGKIEVIVSITSYAKSYNDAAELADVVKAALEDAAVPERFYYLGGSPNYNEEKLISVNQNYKYKN